MLLEIGLANALVATGLALFVFCVSRFCKKPAVIHGLWLLVLVKLVTPPLVPLRLPWTYKTAPSLAQQPPARVQARQPLVVASRTTPEATASAQEANAQPKDELEATFGKFLLDKQPGADGTDISDSARALQGNRRPENVGAEVPLAGELPVSGQQSTKINLEPWLMRAAWLWLGGTVCWFALAVVRIRRFHRLLRFAQSAPEILQEEADALARKLGLNSPPQLWLMPGSIAPLVWATGGRARLYFPGNLLEHVDPEERAALLLHELAHVRRHDHWVRWLELIAMGLYWWYPLVWWACRRLQAAEEDCCDAWVVGELQGREKSYASALLDTVDFLSEARPALPPVASGMARFHDLERRLAMIMRGGTPKHLSRTGQVGLLAFAVFLLPLTPTPAEPQKPAANPPAKLARPATTANKSVLPEEPVSFETKPFNLQQADAGAIWSIVYSPDGKRLATASGGNGDRPGELTVWDAATHDEIYTIQEPDSVRSVAFSPDNKLIATGSFDKTAKLRDAETGKLLVDLRGHRGAVNSVAFSPDGKLLATGSLDSTIKLWEAPSGKLQKTLGSEAELGNATLGRLMSTVKNQLSSSGHTDWVLSVAFSPDGKTLVSASRDQTAKLWDVPTGKEKLTLRGHTNWVECARFTPDGQTVVTASWDFTVKKWDVATGRGQGTLLAHDGYALSIAFTRDGKTMATGGSDATVKLWDAATFGELSSLSLNPGSVCGVAFSPDDRTLATGSWDKTARLWDVSTGQELAKLQRKEYVPENTPALLSAAYSPDRKLLAVGGDNKTVKVYDVAKRSVLTVLRGHNDVVSAVAFSRDGKTLATGSYDQTIMLWEVAKFARVESLAPRATLQGHSNWVFSVAFCPDGDRLASGSYDKTIRLWNTATGKEIALLQGHTAGVRSVAFSPDGTTLASGSTDRTIRIWDLVTFSERIKLRGHKGTVHAVAFSPDEKTLASASEDMTVALWEIETGKERMILKGSAEVWCLAFSPQGRTLATSGTDNLVKLWDPATGKERATLRGHGDTVTALAFAPGARQLASASLDKTLKLWDSVSGKAASAKKR